MDPRPWASRAGTIEPNIPKPAVAQMRARQIGWGCRSPFPALRRLGAPLLDGASRSRVVPPGSVRSGMPRRVRRRSAALQEACGKRFLADAELLGDLAELHAGEPHPYGLIDLSGYLSSRAADLASVVSVVSVVSAQLAQRIKSQPRVRLLGEHVRRDHATAASRDHRSAHCSASVASRTGSASNTRVTRSAVVASRVRHFDPGAWAVPWARAASARATSNRGG